MCYYYYDILNECGMVGVYGGWDGIDGIEVGAIVWLVMVWGSYGYGFLTKLIFVIWGVVNLENYPEQLYEGYLKKVEPPRYFSEQLFHIGKPLIKLVNEQ